MTWVQVICFPREPAVPGCIYPALGYDLDKAGRPKAARGKGAAAKGAAAAAAGVKALGRRVERVGPVSSWRVAYSPKADPMVGLVWFGLGWSGPGSGWLIRSGLGKVGWVGLGGAGRGGAGLRCWGEVGQLLTPVASERELRDWVEGRALMRC